MGGIAGCFNARGRPVDPSLAAGMLSGIAHRGGLRVDWREAAVWLGEAGRELPSDGASRGGSCEPPESRRIVLDGRLDNRAELASMLGCPSNAPDRSIILAAYARWGGACAARIVGDFAFAIWDPGAQALFCARDAFGRKPFYYAARAGDFAFASEPRALLADRALDPRPNEAMVAAFLTMGPLGLEDTLLEPLRRLPPAHSLVVRDGSIRIARYWSFDPAAELRLGGDGEYAECLLAALEEAVASRLRGEAAATLCLSGGVDSSAILDVAAKLRASGALDTRLECLTMAFPGEVCDETAFVEDLLRVERTSSTIIPWKPGSPGHFARRAAQTADFPGYPNGDFVLGPLIEATRALGTQTMLTGQGGDEALTGNLYHYAELLRRFRLGDLLRQRRADRALCEGPIRLVPLTCAPGDLFQYGVLPLLPRPWPRGFSLMRALGRKVQVPEWVSSDLVARVRLQERGAGERFMRQRGSFVRQNMASVIHDDWLVHEVEVVERLAAAHGVEIRAPFMDKRLLELALALPEEQRWRGEQTKFALREAMRGRLPESIRTRRTKSDLSDTVVSTLGELTRGGFWRSMECERRGWLDGARLAEAAEKLDGQFRRGEDGYLGRFWTLWAAAGLELWIRSAAAWRPPADPEAAHVRCMISAI